MVRVGVSSGGQFGASLGACNAASARQIGAKRPVQGKQARHGARGQPRDRQSRRLCGYVKERS